MRTRSLQTAAILLFLPGLSGQSVPEWRFVEELRIGSENDDPTGLSDVRGILVDRKGNLWIIEGSTQEIRVFDPTGKHLRNIGRSGKGPGEFTYADGMATAPDGLVWVHDPKNARFSIFDQDGKFVRQQLALSNGYGYLWRGGIDGKGRVWDALFLYDERKPFASKLRRAAPDWSQVDTLNVPECHARNASPEEGGFRFPRGSMTIPYYPNPVSTWDYNAGAIWCAPTGAEYQLFKIAVDRQDTVARIKGSGRPAIVTAEERDSAIARVEAFKKRAGDASLDYSRIPRVKPIIQAAFVDEEGRLWVRRSSDVGAVFDLYSGQGKAIATLHLPYPVTTYHRPVVRAGRAWFVVQEEGEIPYVIRGRIEPAH